MYSVGIITVSDKGSTGQREDLSGPAIVALLAENKKFNIVKTTILPDEKLILMEGMTRMCDIDKVDLLLTTGGTGFSKRDITPEVTLEIIDKRTPGIPEAMRGYSMTITPRAMLTRAEAGIRGNTLIINMPGSPKAVNECLTFILPSLEHGLDILIGTAQECAQTYHTEEYKI